MPRAGDMDGLKVASFPASNFSKAGQEENDDDEDIYVCASGHYWVVRSEVANQHEICQHDLEI